MGETYPQKPLPTAPETEAHWLAVVATLCALPRRRGGGASRRLGACASAPESLRVVGACCRQGVERASTAKAWRATALHTW
jgi:hypothetical protein